MSGSIIIGIDHGYAAMKTVHFSFPTGLVEYEHEPYRGMIKTDTGFVPVLDREEIAVCVEVDSEIGRAHV